MLGLFRGEPDFLMTEAFKHGDMVHIRTPNAIPDSTALSNTLPSFLALPAGTQHDVSKVPPTHPSYKANHWYPVGQARQSFPQSMGGSDGFDNWVLNSMRINPSEALTKYNTIPKVRLSGLSQSFTAHRRLLRVLDPEQIWFYFWCLPG